MVNFQQDIRKQLEDDYPYSVSIADLSVETTADSEQACSSSDFERYDKCLKKNCSTDPTETCIVKECIHILSRLSAECKFCLVLQAGTNYGNAAACATEPAAYYGRSFGLLLLSKKEILSKHAEGYLGNASEVRGYYQASVSLLPL